MIKKNYISIIGILIIALCTSCDFDFDSKEKEPEVNIKLNKGGFEGIIRLVEKNNSRKTDITFSISKDKIKREQIYSKGKSSQEIGGIIIDLKKDSVTLYFENQTEKRKLLFTTQEYKLRLEEDDLYSYYRTVRTYDDLYLKLNYYHRLLYKKDAFTYSDVHFDYNLYNDIHYRQTIFDSPQIKVNNELLPLLFPGIPDKAPFPVMYTLTSSNRKIHKSDSLQIDVEEPEGILEKILDVLPDIDTIDQELKSIDQKPMDDANFVLDPTKEYVLHTEGFETINSSNLGGGGYGGDDDD